MGGGVTAGGVGAGCANCIETYDKLNTKAKRTKNQLTSEELYSIYCKHVLKRSM